MKWLVDISAIVVLIYGLAELRNMGYRAGRRDADNWWISADKEVDETRQQIWRETPKKGWWV